MHVFALIRFTFFSGLLLLLSLLFPGAGAGVSLAAKPRGGGVGKFFDPLGSALGVHDVITGGSEQMPVEPAVDPTAPPATSPALGPTAAETGAAEEADRLAKAEDAEQLRRRRLSGQTSLTGPLGLVESDTFVTRRSLLGALAWLSLMLGGV